METKPPSGLVVNVRPALPPKLWHRIGAGTAQLEAIRRFMLEQLGDIAVQEPAVHKRIRSADDLLALWYLRCELYQAVLNIDGQEVAARKLEPVNEQFDGLIPPALKPRASPLAKSDAANESLFLAAFPE